LIAHTGQPVYSIRPMRRISIFYPQEGVMVEVTPAATEQIAEYFKGKQVSPIRIFLNEGG